MAVAVSVVLVVLLVLAAPAAAAPADVTVEGEDMTMSAPNSGANAWDSNASGNWGKHIWANSSASKTVTTTRSSIHLFVRVKPHWCVEAPRMTVKAGGRQWWSGPVNAAATDPVTGERLQHVGVRISLPPGTHTIEVAFTNSGSQYVGSQRICQRGIFLDNVTLVATPFSPNGWRNKPLAADAPIASNSTVLRDEIIDQINDHKATGGAGAWIGHDRWSVPVYVVPPDQPTVPVTPDPAHASLAQQWAAVPLPPDARPAIGNDDGHCDCVLVVYQPSTDTLWEFIGLRKENGQWKAYYGGRMPQVSQHEGQFEDPPLGPGRHFGGSATSISYLAGLQRIEEIRRGLETGDMGAIDHAINFIVMTPRGRAGWCYPAQRTDGHLTSLDPSAIPAGTRFRFPANLDLSQYNLHPHARLIAEAIKRYGMVATDSGGNFGFNAEDPFPTGTNPYPGFWNNKYPDAWPNGVLANMPWHELQALAPEGTGCQDK